MSIPDTFCNITHTHTYLQQEYGEDEAEQVDQQAHNKQDDPIAQTGAVEQEQMTWDQAAHQTCCSIQQLHFHQRLHGTQTQQGSYIHQTKCDVYCHWILRSFVLF